MKVTQPADHTAVLAVVVLLLAAAAVWWLVANL